MKQKSNRFGIAVDNGIRQLGGHSFCKHRQRADVDDAVLCDWPQHVNTLAQNGKDVAIGRVIPKDDLARVARGLGAREERREFLLGPIHQLIRRWQAHLGLRSGLRSGQLCIATKDRLVRCPSCLRAQPRCGSNTTRIPDCLTTTAGRQQCGHGNGK